MKMICDNARPLVPSYLDGELSEAQAAPLRAHLFDCPQCREEAKQGTAVKRWFEVAKGGAPTIPEGFAARVARRAFAGDPGTLVPQGAVSDPAGEDAVQPFVLKLAALAAGLLLVFSIAIQRQSLPQGSDLEAQGWGDLPEELFQEDEPDSNPDDVGETEDTEDERE